MQNNEDQDALEEQKEQKESKDQNTSMARSAEEVLRAMGDDGYLKSLPYQKYRSRHSRTSRDSYDEEEGQDEKKKKTRRSKEVPVIVQPIPDALQQHRGSVVQIASNAWQSLVDYFNKPYQPSPELINFLNQFELTVEDFKNTPMQESDELLNQGWYGKLLNAYASNHLLFKLIAFWMLKEEKLKFKAIEENDNSKNIHIELANISKEFKDESSITNIQLDSNLPLARGQIRHPILTMISLSDGQPYLRDDMTEISDFSKTPEQPSSIATTQNSSLGEKLSTLLCCCNDRVWPRNKILLIQDRELLQKAYTVQSGLKTLKLFNRVWAVLILSLMSNDLYYYYNYPEKRYDNTLAKILFLRSEHSKMLSRSLTSIAVWPELLGIPLLLTTLTVLRQIYHPSHSIPSKDIKEIQKYWKGYEPSTEQEITYPILRYLTPSWLFRFCTFSVFPDQSHDFGHVEKTILWDGRVQAKDKIRLFNAIKDLLHRAKKLLHLELLALMEVFAESIHPEDILRLHRYNYDQDTIKALIYVQASALLELKKEAQWKNGWLSAFYAHFLLWNIGQAQNKTLQPFFWIFQTYRWYATINLLIILIQGISSSIEAYLKKRDCENQGKLWSYVNVIQDYDCTACGDLPIPYRRMFTKEDCLYAWFRAQKRTVQELIDFFEHRAQPMDFSDIKTITLDRQHLWAGELQQFLSVLQKHAPNLYELDLNMTRPNIFTCYDSVQDPCAPITRYGLQAIADFIQAVPVKVLDLRGQFIQGVDMDVFGPILNQTQLETLRFDFYYLGHKTLHGPFYNLLGDTGTAFLGQGLVNSTLHTLNLDYTGIGDIGVQALAQSLQDSNLQNLHLANNLIGAQGGIALGQALDNSTLRLLDLGCRVGWQDSIIFDVFLWSITLPCENSIGSEGAQAIASTLPTSSLQALHLSSNNLGSLGIQYLAEALPGSQLQVLHLSSNNLNSLDAQYLAEALPTSSLQVLDLDSNNLGSLGVQYLAEALPTSSLQILNLDSNNLGSLGVQYLAKALPGSQLQDLSLSSNNLGSLGAQYLAEALPTSSLQVLDLSWNNLDSLGAQYLAEALPESQLQVLLLYSNNLGSLGAQYLAKALSTSSLQVLGLSWNNLGSLGVQYLAEALPTSSLQVLDLDSNNLGSLGAQTLTQALTPLAVQTSNLLWIQSLDPDLRRVAGRAQPSTSLTYLGLRSNKITDEDAQNLCYVLPYTDIPANGLDLSNNSISENILSNCGEYISAASHLELPLPFRLVSQFVESIKETIWPAQNFRSKLYNENVILIEATDNEKAKAEEQLITPSPINALLEPFNTLPMPNDKKPFFTLPSTPYQTQNANANMMPTFATFFLLGILLLWVYKKLFDSASKINHYQTSMTQNRNTFFSSQTKDETINNEAVNEDNILHRNYIMN